MLCALTRIAAAIAIALPFACGSPSAQGGSSTASAPRDTVPNIDQSTPEAVLASITDIVATNALGSMKRFCKEGISTGSPTLMMCGIATENMYDVDKFKAWFAAPRLDSAVIIAGDTALLPLTFAADDPKLERHGFLKMVHHEDRWFLNDLIWKR